MKFELYSVSAVLPIYRGLLEKYDVEWSYEIVYRHLKDEIHYVSTKAVIEIDSLDELSRLAADLRGFKSEYDVWDEPEIILTHPKPGDTDRMASIDIYDGYNE